MAASTNGSSTIGRGTVVRGSVRGEGDLDIFGRVEGSDEVGGDPDASKAASRSGAISSSPRAR
jgi:hypothetical protein